MARTRIDCCYQCPDRFPGCHGSCEKYLAQKAELEETKAEARRRYDIDCSVKGQRYDSLYKATRLKNYRDKYRKGR